MPTAALFLQLPSEQPFLTCSAATGVHLMPSLGDCIVHRASFAHCQIARAIVGWFYKEASSLVEWVVFPPNGAATLRGGVCVPLSSACSIEAAFMSSPIDGAPSAVHGLFYNKFSYYIGQIMGWFSSSLGCSVVPTVLHFLEGVAIRLLRQHLNAAHTTSAFHRTTSVRAYVILFLS